MSERRVLVVDDSEVTRAILARTLRGAGFEVLEARDGVEGAVLALRERPSAVVTDLEMPTMDGFPLLRLLKSEPTTAHIPVLILTSHGEAASRFWSERTGADAYLTKDYAAHQLVDTVERLAAAAPASRSGPAPAVGPLDVLARVARQLDASLFQATLINTLLERGMAASGFHEASRIALETLAQVVDTRFLAVAVGEPEASVLHVFLPEPLRDEGLGALCRLLTKSLDPPPGTPSDLEVSGPGAGLLAGPAGRAPALDLERTFLLPLAVRGGRGVLGLLPRDPQHFAAVTRDLVEALAGHLALVLDNARLSQRLHEMSALDGLTRQLNHRAIFDRLGDELERARRYGQSLSVILCDFDHFKAINDRHGHLAGDAVLREGAALLRRTLRTADSLGRYGGEEFLAVLPQVDLPQALAAAHRLRKTLSGAAIPLSEGEEVRITASFGVAELSELPGKVSPELLVSLADQRLYEAKAGGRDCVRPVDQGPGKA